MTIWDVIPDPGPALASLIDDDFYPGPQRIPMPTRGRRVPSLFDIHPDQFPIQDAVAFVEEGEAPAPPDAMQRLVASGIATEFIAGLGALRDPNSPFSPRSIAFPVTLHRVGGPFQAPMAPRIWQLHLSTPACADLPFVRRVEHVTGLTAEWVPDRGRRSLGQWHHAVDLATDEGWERLASSMEHTTPKAVSRSVGIHVGYGSLSVANARRLLSAAGVAEPGTRSCPNIMPGPNSSLMMSLDGWEAVHAVEDGLIVPGNSKKRKAAHPSTRPSKSTAEIVAPSGTSPSLASR
ncbi:hypothetical protein [uncultured Methylobacterium sp.]|uniref:hypothetical protein n=1 Tax=uncultured Methylobacterium sp. TaxID=157278 RepID=UPI0035CAF2E9